MAFPLFLEPGVGYFLPTFENSWLRLKEGTMILKNPLFFLTIATLFVIILAYEKDEFYCKANEQMGFSVCRRCPKLGGNCEELEPSQSCQCDNIKPIQLPEIRLF